jgi:hypothetical protein
MQNNISTNTNNINIVSNNTTNISYEAPFNKTTILGNLFSTRLTAGNFNTSFLANLASNVQTQINTIVSNINGNATLNASNTFTGNLNTFDNVSVNTNLSVEGSAVDFNASLEVFSGSIFLYLGLIRGRADGFNYNNNIYDTYTGYCYTLNNNTGAIPTIDNTLSTITGARSLPRGVYSISGNVIIIKGTATYLNMAPIDVNWICTGGIVPNTINRTYIPDLAGNIRAILPNAYFIITGTSSILRAQYIYDFLNRGNSTVFYEINVIRIA